MMNSKHLFSACTVVESCSNLLIRYLIFSVSIRSPCRPALLEHDESPRCEHTRQNSRQHASHDCPGATSFRLVVLQEHLALWRPTSGLKMAMDAEGNMACMIHIIL